MVREKKFFFSSIEKGQIPNVCCYYCCFAGGFGSYCCCRRKVSVLKGESDSNSERKEIDEDYTSF